jgi:hypothetical protein
LSIIKHVTLQKIVAHDFGTTYVFSYINKLNLKLQGPDTTIFNAWNNIKSFKKKLKLWLNMTAYKKGL